MKYSDADLIQINQIIRNNQITCADSKLSSELKRHIESNEIVALENRTKQIVYDTEWITCSKAREIHFLYTNIVNSILEERNKVINSSSRLSIYDLWEQLNVDQYPYLQRILEALFRTDETWLSEDERTQHQASIDEWNRYKNLSFDNIEKLHKFVRPEDQVTDAIGSPLAIPEVPQDITGKPKIFYPGMSFFDDNSKSINAHILSESNPDWVEFRNQVCKDNLTIQSEFSIDISDLYSIASLYKRLDLRHENDTNVSDLWNSTRLKKFEVASNAEGHSKFDSKKTNTSLDEIISIERELNKRGSTASSIQKTSKPAISTICKRTEQAITDCYLQISFKSRLIRELLSKITKEEFTTNNNNHGLNYYLINLNKQLRYAILERDVLWRELRLNLLLADSSKRLLNRVNDFVKFSYADSKTTSKIKVLRELELIINEIKSLLERLNKNKFNKAFEVALDAYKIDYLDRETLQAIFRIIRYLQCLVMYTAYTSNSEKFFRYLKEIEESLRQNSGNKQYKNFILYGSEFVAIKLVEDFEKISKEHPELINKKEFFKIKFNHQHVNKLRDKALADEKFKEKHNILKYCSIYQHLITEIGLKGCKGIYISAFHKNLNTMFAYSKHDTVLRDVLQSEAQLAFIEALYDTEPRLKAGLYKRAASKIHNAFQAYLNSLGSYIESSSYEKDDTESQDDSIKGAAELAEMAYENKKKYADPSSDETANLNKQARKQTPEKNTTKQQEEKRRYKPVEECEDEIHAVLDHDNNPESIVLNVNNKKVFFKIMLEIDFTDQEKFILYCFCDGDTNKLKHGSLDLTSVFSNIEELANLINNFTNKSKYTDISSKYNNNAISKHSKKLSPAQVATRVDSIRKKIMDHYNKAGIKLSDRGHYITE